MRICLRNAEAVSAPRHHPHSVWELPRRPPRCDFDSAPRSDALRAAPRRALCDASVFTCVSGPVQAMVASLLDDARFVDGYLETNALRLAASCAHLCHALDALALPYVAPDAGMFLWVDLRALLRRPSARGGGAAPTTDDEAALYEQLRRELRLVLTPGAAQHAQEVSHGGVPRNDPVPEQRQRRDCHTQKLPRVPEARVPSSPASRRERDHELRDFPPCAPQGSPPLLLCDASPHDDGRRWRTPLCGRGGLVPRGRRPRPLTMSLSRATRCTRRAGSAFASRTCRSTCSRSRRAGSPGGLRRAVARSRPRRAAPAAAAKPPRVVCDRPSNYDVPATILQQSKQEKPRRIVNQHEVIGATAHANRVTGIISERGLFGARTALVSFGSLVVSGPSAETEAAVEREPGGWNFNRTRLLLRGTSSTLRRRGGRAWR